MSSHQGLQDVGCLGDDRGRLDVYFNPENLRLFIRAYVPSDRRRADISITDAGSNSLRSIVEAIETLAERAKQERDAENAGTTESEGISFLVMNTRVVVPDAVLANIAQLIAHGAHNDKVIERVSAAFPMLVPQAAQDLAFKIYAHLRPRA